MNPVVQMFINALLKYLESHPDQVEKLIESLVQWIISALTASRQS